MNFIKQMKKREFIEMGLKALAALMAAFIAIILMEGMIYGINLKAIKEQKHSMSTSSSTIAYCIEQGDDQYYVIYRYDPNPDNNDDSDVIWSSNGQVYSKEDCTKANLTAGEIKFRAPTAFELTITPVHYVVMAVFVAAIAGFFVYKFVALSNLYKKVEEDFEKTGAISIGNV